MGDFTATLFAPTNEAFDQALNALGLTAEELLADTDTLQSILRYHSIPDVAAQSTDLQNNQILTTLLPGGQLEIDLDDGVQVKMLPSGAEVNVVDPDQIYCNVVGHG